MSDARAAYLSQHTWRAMFLVAAAHLRTTLPRDEYSRDVFQGCGVSPKEGPLCVVRRAVRDENSRINLTHRAGPEEDLEAAIICALARDEPRYLKFRRGGGPPTALSSLSRFHPLPSSFLEEIYDLTGTRPVTPT